jgi:hypothetical protein
LKDIQVPNFSMNEPVAYSPTGKAMSLKPLDAGPIWDILEKLDLNRHRDNPIEENERAVGKIKVSREYSGSADAAAREHSGVGTIICNAAVVHHHARRGFGHSTGSQKGGKSAGDKKKADAKKLHKDIVARARAMLEAGTPRRGLAGRIKTKFRLTSQRINAILKAAGV